MELRHLRYFCAVAEERSFTAAGRRLNVSQSGVSGQIRDLEAEMGVTLLRRNQREVSLTSEGAAFLTEARDILARTESAVEMARKASHGEVGKLTIGLCGPVTAMFLPKLIRKFRKQNPAVTLALKERAPYEQVDSLLRGEIDVGFTRTVSPAARRAIKSELLFREPIVAAISKDNPLAKEKVISVPRLSGQALVLHSREAGADIFDPIVAMCARARFTPKIMATAASWQSVLTLVEAGEGIGLIPACVQQLRTDDVVFRPLGNGRCHLDAIVAWCQDEPNAARDGVLRMLREKRAEWGIAGPAMRLRNTA